MFPFYQIERVGGKEEKNYETDILIKLPSIISDYGYAIAIQVKDYAGFVGNEIVNQINKSEIYWDNENLKLIERIVIIIERIVIITKATKDDNIRLLEHDKNVKFIFATELKQLLSDIGKSFVGMK